MKLEDLFKEQSLILEKLGVKINNYISTLNSNIQKNKK